MVEKCLKAFNDKYLDLVILFFFPLVQLSINRNWIFNPLQALPSARFQDSWFYNGMFFYFFEYANEDPMSRHYFVERLPSVLPGYYLYLFLSPIKANYILHLGYYYIAVFSIYFVLFSLLNRRSALITSLAMGSYPWFLRAVGWDYIDGVGIAYYCLSMALLVAAVKLPYWRLFLFYAGLSIACLVYTNLFWIPFVLILMLFYVVLNHSGRRRNLLLSGLYVGGGAVAITGFFSIFFYFATGRFWFFEQSIKAAIKISNDSTLTPLIEAMYRSMEPFWLILPILILVIVFLELASRRFSLNGENDRIQLILLFQFCLSFGFLVFWHVFFQPYLNIFLYMSYLIPATFLLFGKLISNSLHMLTDRQFSFVSAAAIAIFSAPLALTLSKQYFDKLVKLQDNWIVLLSISLIFISSLLVHSRYSVVIACVAAAAIGFIGGADTNVYVQDRWKGKDNFKAVVEAVRAIDKIYPDNDQNLVFMYDLDNFNVPAVAIGGIYIDMSGRLIGYEEDRPIGWDAIIPFNDSDIVLIAQRGNAFEQIKEQFSQHSAVELDLKAQIPIQSGETSFFLFLFHMYFQELDRLHPGDTFEFDRPFKGKNFYAPEIVQDESHAWSGPETESEIYLKLGHLDRDINLLACIRVLQPEILDSFQLYVNGVYVPTTRSTGVDCPSLFIGTIPKAIISESPEDITTFTFRVDQTVSPIDLGINVDPRKLGLSFDWIRIK